MKMCSSSCSIALCPLLQQISIQLHILRRIIMFNLLIDKSLHTLALRLHLSRLTTTRFRVCMCPLLQMLIPGPRAPSRSTIDYIRLYSTQPLIRFVGKLDSCSLKRIRGSSAPVEFGTSCVSNYIVRMLDDLLSNCVCLCPLCKTSCFQPPSGLLPRAFSIVSQGLLSSLYRRNIHPGCGMLWHQDRRASYLYGYSVITRLPFSSLFSVTSPSEGRLPT